MSGEELIEKLERRFGDAILDSSLEAIDPWIEVAASSIVEICKHLRDDSDLQLDMLNCITAVDYFQPDPKKAAKTKGEPHIQLVYHLSSIKKKHTLKNGKMQKGWGGKRGHKRIMDAAHAEARKGGKKR